MVNLMNLEYLVDTIEEKLDMEMMDYGEIVKVEDVITNWYSTESKQTADSIITRDELNKFKDYYCTYCIDIEGSVWGQAFVILDKNLKFIDFVRTI